MVSCGEEVDMRKRFVWLAVAFGLAVALPACGARDGAETAPSPGSGAWELVCGDYNPVSYDLCDAITFPEFEGKTREEWERYSISIGKIDNEFLVWAVDGRLSPDGRRLAYASDKDCLEAGNAMSVFLLDLESGKERVLLSGAEGLSHRALAWLDENTLFCLSATSYDGAGSPDSEYLICDLEGRAIPLPPDAFAGTQLFAAQGRLLAFAAGSEDKSLRLVRIEGDGSLSELAGQDFDGYPINGGGISPDGKWVAFPLLFSRETGSRAVCLWNTETGAVTILENPTPGTGNNPAAIQVRWDSAHPEIDFHIPAADSNGHNELWRYAF
jgi:WD40 repeat protein